MQGRTTRQTYSDAGQKWSWSNGNYMFTMFELTSEDMAKFARAMIPEDAGEGRVSRTEKKSKS